MVDRKDPLPVTRQCELLDLPRSTFYHVPTPVSDEELELMALMDRCHLLHPYYGSRRIRDWLEDQGRPVNRKKVRRLMRTMDLAAQYPKRNLSLANRDCKSNCVTARASLPCTGGYYEQRHERRRPEAI